MMGIILSPSAKTVATAAGIHSMNDSVFTSPEPSPRSSASSSSISVNRAGPGNSASSLRTSLADSSASHNPRMMHGDEKDFRATYMSTGECVGSGTFGRVVVIIRREDGMRFAVKLINKSYVRRWAFVPSMSVNESRGKTVSQFPRFTIIEDGHGLRPSFAVARALHVRSLSATGINCPASVDGDVVPLEVASLWHLQGHRSILCFHGAYELPHHFAIVTDLLAENTPAARPSAASSSTAQPRIGWLDLFDFIETFELSESIARTVFRQLLSALRHCHKRGIVHGDVKDENIKVNATTLQVVLIDFGSCQILDKEEHFRFLGRCVKFYSV
eukprot:Opistho-2@53601